MMCRREWQRWAPVVTMMLALNIGSLAAEQELTSNLASDDECTSDGTTDCAMVALQHKAARSTTGVTQGVANTLDALEAHLQDVGFPDDDGDGGVPSSVLAAVTANSQSDLFEEGVADSGAAGMCPMNHYNGSPKGGAACFCQKAHNVACTHKACACREGCRGYLQQHYNSVSFRNNAQTSCSAALLTVSRSYFTDIQDMKRSCGGGGQGLLTSMLRDSFISYEGFAPTGGGVMQCIHAAGHVSVLWLHLHTFCTQGTVDNLPNKDTAYCSRMTGPAQAGQIAAKFMKWSR